MKEKLVRAYVTCLGLGLSPKGPGTVTSVVAVIFWAGLHYLSVSRALIYALLLLFFVVGVLLVKVYEKKSQSEDASEITIDEWVGMGISLIGVPLTWPMILAAFILFRIFDIWKPLGIQYFQRNYLEGWGVMMDDVIAGLYTCLLIGGFQWLSPHFHF